MPDRLLSLAAGTVLDLQPPEAVGVAADAGFGAVGVWYDSDSWSAARARRFPAASTQPVWSRSTSNR